jgi:hypothetical protein
LVVTFSVDVSFSGATDVFACYQVIATQYNISLGQSSLFFFHTKP